MVVRWLLSVATLVALGASSADAAERLHITCRDGSPRAKVELGDFARREPVCDFDGACNGECTFAFCSLGEFLCAHHPLCVGPGSGLCTGAQPPSEQFTVRVGGKKLLRYVGFGFTLVLRCRPPLAGRCPCGLGGGGEAGQCGGACPGAGEVCSLTPGIEGAPPGCECVGPCEVDADCDDGNACTEDTCLEGSCRHACQCFGALDCCPGPACAGP